jgi:hypothetical protein
VSLFGKAVASKSADPEAGGAGYDRLGVPEPGGALRFLTKEEFEGLPLVDRVRMLSAGGLRFFRQGKEVSPREALRGRA